MQAQYQARWISREKFDALRKSAPTSQVIVLDTLNGFILVEPVGSNLDDGRILSAQEAGYELQPVWYLGPKSRLREARKRLGLETAAPEELVPAGAAEA